MEIVPSSKIYILRDVPLDKTYEHTLFFDSAVNQYSYFYSKRKWTFDDSTYQRVNRGRLQIGKPADDLYDCNYLMFNNGQGAGTAYFKDKWFYAFIKSIEYINPEVCEIEYEIDVMQTWFYDYTVEDSFIEREHSLTDVPGENLVPENLETGEYMYSNEIRFTPPNMPNTWDVIIAATWRYNDGAFTPYGGGNYGGVFSGLFLNHFTTPQDAADCIEAAATATGDQTQGIVGVYMIPHWMWLKYYMQTPDIYFDVQVPKIVNYTNIWGFTPKNKKLLTSPYLTLLVTNNNGDYGEYPYEYFSTAVSQDNPSANPCFRVYGTLTPDGAMKCIPLDYKDIAENYNEHISITALPQCSYNVDTFRAWWAQNNITTYTNLGLQAANVGMSMASGNVGGMIGAVGNVAGTLANFVQHSRMPNTARGGNTNTLLMLMGKMHFSAYGQYIRPEFAHIIDEYFNVYGYATHRVKKPNIGTRPFWNYVKTLRVNLSGSVPCDDMQNIADIYNRGVTFWKVNSGVVNVGDYSQDNSPST